MGEFANLLKLLTDKAFPDLENEYMGLTQFMGQVEAQGSFQCQTETAHYASGGGQCNHRNGVVFEVKPSHVAQVEPE